MVQWVTCSRCIWLLWDNLIAAAVGVTNRTIRLLRYGDDFEGIMVGIAELTEPASYKATIASQG
jgi:hypothetical protein